MEFEMHKNVFTNCVGSQKRYTLLIAVRKSGQVKIESENMDRILTTKKK